MSEGTADLLKTMEGVTVALVTPLNAERRLDVEALERLIERVIQHGACAVFPLSWCGEQPMLPDNVRGEMLRETTRIVNHRVPVMAGVSEQSLPRALELACIARAAGADLIIATPPYSYPAPQEFVLQYFSELARESGMPLVVYQNDEVSVRVEIDTIRQLSETAGVIGVKGYMPFLELQAAYHEADRPGRFAVMGANECLFGPSLFLGLRHFTMGTPGNVCMKWCVSTYRSAIEGNWDDVRRKHKRLIDLCAAMSRIPAPFMAVKKHAMSRLGICSPYVIPPVRQLGPAEQKLLDSVLEEFQDVFDPGQK